LCVSGIEETFIDLFDGGDRAINIPLLSMILASISVFLFTLSAWIGFVPLDKEHFNENQWENRVKKWTNKMFEKCVPKWQWPRTERYALTKLGLALAAILGFLGIWLPKIFCF
jgi:hypothetical protein